MAARLRILNPKKTLFLLCDIQEKFRPGIPLFDNVVKNAAKLVSLIWQFSNLYYFTNHQNVLKLDEIRQRIGYTIDLYRTLSRKAWKNCIRY